MQLIPTIVVTKDGLVVEAYACEDKQDLEEAFSVESRAYGYVPHDGNYDDGYVALECGTIIQMCWVVPVEKLN